MTFANVSEISSRDKILDAAERLFAQRGYAGVGLREVAEAVGLGKSSLFHHFKNKPELYAAVCGRILARIRSRLMEALARGGSPVERLERLLDELVDVLAEHPNDARLLLRSLFEDDDLPGDTAEERAVQEALESIIGAMSSLLREGMSSGQLRAANVQHLLLTVIGQTVFPFASGDFGRELLGKDVFDRAEVVRRKQEVRDLLRYGLIVRQND
jgi:AcrR family transcriptional regulator